MQTDESTSGQAAVVTPSSTPEVEFYAFLLVLIFTTDGKQFQQVIIMNGSCRHTDMGQHWDLHACWHAWLFAV